MSIAAVGSAHSTPIAPERAEGPAQEHDGDSDDTAAVQAPVQAAPAPGTGVAVDKSA